MPEATSNYQVKLSRLFKILIACVVLVSCASHSPAPVYDKSRSFANRPKTHIVAPGDTMFSIAWRYGLKYEELAKYNKISPPYIIRPSQVIRLDMVGGAASPVQTQSGGKSVVTNSKLSGPAKTPTSTNKNSVIRKENKTTTVGQSNKNSTVWGAPQWRWPAKGSLISSFQGNNGLNKGIDLGGKLGEPVLAAAAGQVVYSGSGLRGYGKLLIVKHNEVFLSAYAHNDRLLVKEGDFVKAGQIIADMGSSGTDRVKLHFEIRRDGTPVDPLKYLPRR
ncbi:MAG: peptidoglycan DD-metalloendopeptidase family protein [Cellvibrio sp.]|uniref:peptidoglycan DD-metalloendopeptidase family protein n=1 Tax=Cellvibrio sp. TaxID=1965322 RepID=UPI0031AF5D37